MVTHGESRKRGKEKIRKRRNEGGGRTFSVWGRVGEGAEGLGDLLILLKKFGKGFTGNTGGDPS